MISLHRDLLHDYHFSCLSDEEKWHALSGAFRGESTLATPFVRVATGRMSGPAWRSLRAEVFARDGHRCTYCGAFAGPMECDHVLPHARGGADSLDNLTTACRSCNRRKHVKTPAEWGA